ncbi:MAG: hypothetical protein HY713_02730 [candidate division NC10 bacterium]|nr:hypothetical protein [candidate division NC10 bacterium]
MGAILLRREKYVDADGDLVELVLWQVPRSAAYPDGIRYRLAFVLAGTTKPAVLYDNHHPKGHHRHCGAAQIAYTFSTVGELLVDFLADVRRAKVDRKEATR